MGVTRNIIEGKFGRENVCEQQTKVKALLGFVYS